MKNLTALLIATMLLALATVSAVPLVNPSSTQQPVQLAAVANTQPKLGNFGNFSITTGTYDPNNEMLVTISFFPQHDLQQYLNLVSKPNSPAFHAFLSPTQIASGRQYSIPTGSKLFPVLWPAGYAFNYWIEPCSSGVCRPTGQGFPHIHRRLQPCIPY